MKKPATQLPSRQQILDWIAQNPGDPAKRDIARAFGIKGPLKIELKRMLKAMETEGALEKKARRYGAPGELPAVAVLQVTGPDRQGDLFATALEWEGEGEAPRILVMTAKEDPALGAGDRILVRLTKVEGEGHSHTARLIRRIGQGARRILGLFRKSTEGGRILPIDKGETKEWLVGRDATQNARDGELVEAELVGKRESMGLPRARIIARLGDPGAPRAVSLIAIHQHGIPDDFPDDVVMEAERQEPAPLGDREDLRHLPLVTIDPADARDRDDAVLAHADTDKTNPGGHVIWVAIADVAHYVRPGSLLDREARKRGNSTYFPDRVVPMLPDRLSGDLCSLHQGVDRACLAVCMRIDAQGNKISHRFTRGLMRSQASLAYEAVQAAVDGRPDAQTEPLLEPVLRPLYAAYDALKRARAVRQPLELDLPERRIILSDEGKVVSVAFKERYDAHKLIEEFMVLANVAAAEELERVKRPLLYRVHEEPSLDKIDALREVAEASGFVLAKGQVLKTQHLNNLLRQAEGSDFDELLNLTTLRSMTQAYYDPRNLGHFGLALRSYAHFTSPIRRYSDLIVHRALILGHGWGDDGLSRDDIEVLAETAKQISDTERRSMAAERDTTDRYLASWLSDRVGAEFTGRISGVQRFGLFVRLDESGADGLIPIREIGREFFHYDPDSQTLMGADTGLTLGVGLRVTVRLTEAVPVTGGLLLELLSVEDKGLPSGRAARTRKSFSRGKGRSHRPSDRPGAKSRKITRKPR
ncbi:RNAse R [Gemmobacter megaterium]|uniref:Ribonuclease R n=1 Tax=Gemmobacter megaterium TaxID=1086013 RepID=A0A1N7M2Y8_9RHOB|nr:ribonuclease R [Gemmobacter megaterium]GGE09203.1 ribonuclease R [Gemmobacter megaterium]SIS80311.1 RNAse R [Gemmobacter megaterium]